MARNQDTAEQVVSAAVAKLVDITISSGAANPSPAIMQV
jgi:hypothetical protein